MTLVTVVDNQNRPLCHMPLAEARAQGLVWRSVALLATVPGGKLAFLWKTPTDIGLPVFEPLPAFQNGGDFCATKLEGFLGDAPAAIAKIAIRRPCPENTGTFTAIYRARLRHFEETPTSRLFLADLSELAGLEKHGCAVHPFLKLALADLSRP